MEKHNYIADSIHQTDNVIERIESIIDRIRGDGQSRDDCKVCMPTLEHFLNDYGDIVKRQNNDLNNHLDVLEEILFGDGLDDVDNSISTKSVNRSSDAS